MRENANGRSESAVQKSEKRLVIHKRIGQREPQHNSAVAQAMIDDGLPTLTSEEQVELERKVVDIYMSAYPEGVQGYRRLQRFSLQSRRRRRRRRPLLPAASRPSRHCAMCARRMPTL